MTTIRITLPGRPVTKKNSPSVVPMMSMSDIQDLRQALAIATSHKESIAVIMRKVRFSVQPSDAYQNWLTEMLLHRTSIASGIRAGGVSLPIKAPVSIAAVVYRAAEVGDWTGYADAIADAIQSEVWQCHDCRKKSYSLRNCIHCGASIAKMKLSRQGLGLIQDDKQIAHWDGTRLYCRPLIRKVEPEEPRIELAITILEPAPALKPQNLFASEGALTQ